LFVGSHLSQTLVTLVDNPKKDALIPYKRTHIRTGSIH
jgi:hypothetical protein